ncbi:DUF1801 domain-containing protein [Luteimonas sp. SMYT11W]|uniref:DUF1801 domain-containing protein n=1 Tax=Luteimonas flava TaxID=3115822 RepID=A0ABU7WHU2_9GAMM
MAKTARPRHSTPADTSVAVDAFMAALDHPHAGAVQRLRALVLGVDPTIAEGVKWNAPSWRTTEYFATTQLRAASGIGLVLHRGAKARALPDGGLAIDDPDGLLTWPSPDRALLAFADRDAVDSGADAVQALLRQWIAHV